MSDPQNNKFTQFWQELKRRKVIKANAMYLATAFIILEVVDIITPALHLPSWTVTLVLVLLAVGFPISIILSWIFDVTPEGFVKTESVEDTRQKKKTSKPGRRKFQLSDGIIIVLLVVVMILIYPRFFNKDKFENIREEDGRISIAVLPFQNLTADTMYNVWQEGVQNLLINKLSNSPELSVRQSQTMFDILESTGQTTYAAITPSIASEIASKLATNTFIVGNIMKAGDKVRISAQLRDATSEVVFKSYEIEGYLGDDFFAITDSLSNLLKNYLEIEVLKQDAPYDYSSWAFTSSAKAYRYYLQGLDFYFNADYPSAIDVFNKAIEIDTSFFAAYSWLVQTYESDGFLRQDYDQIEKARQLLRKFIGWETEKLSHIQQLTLNLAIAKYVDKDPQEYIKDCRLILEYDPQQRLFWYNLGEAYRSIWRYDRAIEAFEQALEIGRRWGVEEWIRTSARLGAVYHEVGDHDKEREVYEAGLRNLPNNYEIVREQGKCALSRGDTAAAREYISRYKTLCREFRYWNESAISHRIAHMHVAAGLIEEAEEIWQYTRRSEPGSLYHQRCHAEFLIMKDFDVKRGLEIVNNILESDPDYYDILYFKGVALFKLGMPEQALEILQQAWEKRFSYRHDHYLAIKEVEQTLANLNN
jgi:tetratricopeptide (TPR) repeat protein